MTQSILVQSSVALQGNAAIPGDKSITHRALLISALTKRTITVINWLAGLDCCATINMLEALGVKIYRDPCKTVICGVGLHGLQQPAGTLQAGNSGTSMRLITGILSAQKFSSQITGDSSLCARPMNRIIDPMTLMGAKITAVNDQYAPLHIYGGNQLQSITYTLPIASAQVKSAILLADLYAQGTSKVLETIPSRNHTELMLQCLFSSSSKHNIIDIPGDLSSAAFFIVAACIVPNSDVYIKNVGLNPTRTGVIKILRSMGANIQIFNLIEKNSESRADIRVRYASLQAVHVPSELIPNAIDEIPILAVAAACAIGTTVIRGAQELRYKESDRIAALVVGLKTLGVLVQEFPDGLAVTGGELMGGKVDSRGDHRIAMAFAIAGLVASEPVIVQNTANIATSFPNFIQTATQIGMQISEGEF